MIKTWEERCVEHPDHQSGMVSYAMIQARMQEEIDELRAAVFDPDWDRVKALEESLREHMAEIQRLKALAQPEPNQDLQLVANFLKEYGLEALEVIAALKTKPEPMLNGLTEEETNASASVMGLTRPQPVAWINEHGHIDRGLDAILEPTGWTPLYTAPPQRKPLTEEEVDTLSRTMVKGNKSVNWLCRAIERAHGIGGHDA